MWWFLPFHFGFRAKDESRKLLWGDVELQQHPLQDGREMLVWINERETKTQKGRENGHKRAFQPKIYATGTERCPIKLNKFFRDHRPVEMKQPNSDSSGSHHLPENPTSNGGLLTTEAVEHKTSTNSFSVAQASLNQLRGASDLNSWAVFVGANISNISGCQFQIFSGLVNFVYKRRRFQVIETGEEHWNEYFERDASPVCIFIWAYQDTVWSTLIEVWMLIFENVNEFFLAKL